MSIHDDTTNNFIQSITNDQPQTLGVTRHLVDGEWFYTWSDMTWWDYQKWNSVQDEHRENANHQYVQMTGASWSAITDQVKNGYVCQQGWCHWILVWLIKKLKNPLS